MATPVSDSYSCASGGRIVAGLYGLVVAGCAQSASSTNSMVGSGTASLTVQNSVQAASSQIVNVSVMPAGTPSWVPPPGTAADVSLNNLYDVRGTVSDYYDTRAIFAAWSGAAYVSSYGTYGSMIFTGGGHGDGVDNSIYRYDIANRMFSKIKDRATAYGHLEANGDQYIADTVTGWMWANSTATDTTKQVGEPFTSHFYAHLVGVPAASLAGASNGWLFTPGRGVMPLPGQRGTSQAHKIALGTDTKWTFHGSALPSSPGYGCALHDSSRNRVVSFPSGGVNNMITLDVPTAAAGNVSLTGSAYDSYYACADYSVADDLYMLARIYDGGGSVNTLMIVVIDPVTNQIYHPSYSGTLPVEVGEGAWAWCEAWHAWVMYPGRGGNNVYTLKAPANPRTGQWTLNKQTVTGTVRQDFRTEIPGSGPPYNRLRFVSDLGILLWAPKHDQPLQAINISAP